jgi:hypothetical protein
MDIILFTGISQRRNSGPRKKDHVKMDPAEVI